MVRQAPRIETQEDVGAPLQRSPTYSLHGQASPTYSAQVPKMPQRRNSLQFEVRSASQETIQFFRKSLPQTYQPSLDVQGEYVEPALRHFRDAVTGINGRGLWERELYNAELDELRGHLGLEAATYARRNEVLRGERDE